MTRASVPADVRAALGIGDNLVRLSVGIEDVDDLVADSSARLSRSSAQPSPGRCAGQRKTTTGIVECASTL